MFLLIKPNVLAESPCASDSANEAAGKHQESVARDFRVPWRGDSALDDGKDAGVDLTGGYVTREIT